MAELLKKLEEYTASGALPMHMPGHKRNIEAFDWLKTLGGKLDLTEIDGFDCLNDPQTLFRELERRVAALWGAGESICLVNGSTSGVLAAVRAALERGGDLIVFRGCHKSVYHGAELVGCGVGYLTPARYRTLGIWGSVTAQEVEQALQAHPGARLVAITSPTYEGVISDIRAIARVCHRRGAALFVDEAHGAHLGFGGFPDGAVRQGADLVVQSLHKTLPSLTQTAVLHIGGDLLDPADVRRNAAVFQSSSPSYLLSASIDGCVNYLQAEGTAAGERWLAALGTFYKRTAGVKNLRILGSAEGFFARDPSKIVIDTSGTNLTGGALMALFRERFQIELEMAAGKYVVAMTGMGDTQQSLGRFAEAVLAADEMCKQEKPVESAPDFQLPTATMPIHDALMAPGSLCHLEQARGRICGEYVWAYPPGAPLLVPGETVSHQVLETIRRTENVRSTRGAVPKMIFCVGKT